MKEFIVALLLCCVSAFVPAQAEDKPINGSCTTGGQRQSILGMATMAADGSIVASIEGPGPMHTKSVVRLKPGDKEYESFLKHIGGLKPGETKPLPVWDTPTKKE